MKIIALFIFFLFPFIVNSQSIKLKKLIYHSQSIKQGDTTYKKWIYLLDDHRIFTFESNDTANNTFTDFKDNKLEMKSNGGKSHIFDISKNRDTIKFFNYNDSFNYKVQLKREEKERVAREPITGMFVAKSYETVYFDTTYKVPFYNKGGYGGAIDNGHGYLLVRMERITKNEDDTIKYSMISDLINREEITMDKKEFDRIIMIK